MRVTPLAWGLCLGVLWLGADTALAGRAPVPRPERTTTINEDTTWAAGKRIAIKRSLIVAEGVTLTIEPGVRVLFEPNTYLHVKGTIVAVGQHRKTIVFEAKSKKKGWRGIAIQNEADSPSKLTWCVVRFAKVGLCVLQGTVAVDSCEFRLNGTGMRLGEPDAPPGQTDVTAVNSLFGANQEYGVHIIGQSPTLERCTIQQNRKTGVYIQFGDRPRLTGCLITRNVRAGIFGGKRIEHKRRPRRPADHDGEHDDELVRHDVTLTCTGSNLFSNGRLDIYNGSSGDWTCTDNFWGTRASRVLKKEKGNLPNVFDHQDNDQVGSVTCRPFAEKKLTEVGANLNPRKKPVTPPATKPTTKPEEPEDDPV